MRIVCDADIPFLVETVREGWPEVDICPMKSEEIDSPALLDADVLIVRTRTKVDADLLRGTKVQQVCTATIGYDHIDTAYCEAQGIRWMACPGCNAQAVCEYIEEAVEEYIGHWSLVVGHSTPTIGIVGVGHVGTLVAEMAERKGMKVLLNDPPKGIGVPLDEIARKSDIITFHVPLTGSRQNSAFSRQTSGFSCQNFPTYHLCEEGFLRKCKPEALIINASRGGVVDEQALLRSGRRFILDTWEGEPHICPEVLSHAFLASMHIAGYSIEGKRNATQMCLDAVAARWGLPPLRVRAPKAEGDSRSGWLRRVSERLKAQPEAFENLRRNYLLR